MFLVFADISDDPGFDKRGTLRTCWSNFNYWSPE